MKTDLEDPNNNTCPSLTYYDNHPRPFLHPSLEVKKMFSMTKTVFLDVLVTKWKF